MPNPFYISFPGLGIAPFEVNKVAFNLFGRDVAWYGVIICFGLILAFLYGIRTTKREGVSMDDFLNLLLLIIPFGIIGARLYHVLMELDHYIGRPFLEWIAIWNGGGAIYGSIIAGILVIIFYTKIKKLNLFAVLDAFSPCLIIGQMIGRWGNFVNGEAYGSLTDLPWRMGLGITENVTEFYHPTFFYESLWNFTLLVIIHFFLYRAKKYDGEIFLFYLAFYGLGRMIVEFFRIDSSPVVLGMRIAGLVGLVCFLLFGSLFVLGFLRAKKAKKAEMKEEKESENEA